MRIRLGSESRHLKIVSKPLPWHQGRAHRVGVTAGFVGIVLALGAVVAAPASWAGPPAGVNCNPSGTVCQFSNPDDSYGPVDTGIVCGTGSRAFDIFDQGVEDDRGTAWFDPNGNITKIIDDQRYALGVWSNPETGDVVTYTQHNVETTVLATPGDFSTATQTVTGENIYRTAAGTGKDLFLASGRQVFDPSGGLVSSTPNNGFIAAFFQGDTTAFDQVCAALGA